LEQDIEKMQKAREVLQKMANGINPVSGQTIEKEHFLQDPRIIRCMFFIADVLKRQIDETIYRERRPTIFSITAEEKERIEFPAGKIGVNEFSRCVNHVIDISRSKKLTGVELNKRLKKMGLLNEEKTPDGRTRTTLDVQSAGHGFETGRKTYNGHEYEMVLFNDQGKRYLLDNLEIIMAVEV
jgi:hypothetical protein